MTLFCHVGKEVQEFRPLAIQAASTAEVYLAVVSRPSSSRIARIAPNMTEEGLLLLRSNPREQSTYRSGRAVGQPPRAYERSQRCGPGGTIRESNKSTSKNTSVIVTLCNAPRLGRA